MAEQRERQRQHEVIGLGAGVAPGGNVEGVAGGKGRSDEGVRHADSNGDNPQQRLALQQIQQELATTVVEQRLYREADLEALFQRTLQSVPAVKRKLVALAISQLRVELELPPAVSN